ncbi:MAG: YncE family protein [Fidelibacterota bacterium]
MKKLIPILLMTISCSLYEDKDDPDIYFEINNFDILKLGKTISDMMLGPNGQYLYLCDYNNNSILKVSLNGKMKLIGELVLGSHPTAMDTSPDKSLIAIAMRGESKVFIISLADFSISSTFAVSLMNMNDIVYANDHRLLISSSTDPTVIAYDLNSNTETSQSILNGELIVDQNDSIAYVASASSIKKYDISNNQAFLEPNVADPFGFSALINHFIISQDKKTLFLCLTNPDDHSTVNSVYAYNAETLTFAGQYKIKSPGMGVAVSGDNDRIFIAPTDADKNGVFVVEFDAKTKLESHYYLVAGNLKERCLVIDQNADYFYVLVNTPGDNNSFEPYNNFSFDLQRVRIYN